MKKNKSGFTLIELLLGLSIFAVIALSLYSTFAGGIKLSQRSEKQNNLFREARMAYDLMSRELENMVVYDFSRSYPEKASFQGGEEKITFISRTDDGLKVISYYLISPQRDRILKTVIGNTYAKNVSVITNFEQRMDVYYLMREEKDFVDFLSGQSEENTRVEILSTNIQRDGLEFNFGYLEGEGSEDISWKDYWTDNLVPGFVRIKLSFMEISDKKDSFGEGNNMLNLTKDVFIPQGVLRSDES